MTRHLLGLFQGQPGARPGAGISRSAPIDRRGVEVVVEAALRVNCPV